MNERMRELRDAVLSGREALHTIGSAIGRIDVRRERGRAGRRLGRVAAEEAILLAVCDGWTLKGGLADGEPNQCGKGEVIPQEVTPEQLLESVSPDGFPPPCAARAPTTADQVITH
ncbi:MAG: hypothetical protein AAFW01_17860 [Pseudomonadota bacterium]